MRFHDYLCEIKKIAIIGGGAASFVAADCLSRTHHVTIYEKGSTIGRKFLVAGKGGFNLSHHIGYPEIAKKYSPKHLLDQALTQFTPNDLRNWYAGLGISTYVGSSSRIFPEKGISPADVLRAIKKKLKEQGVEIKYKHEFIGFDSEQQPLVKHNGISHAVQANIYIFALGGASWSVTGSTGNWLPEFEEIGVNTIPFESSNTGLNIQWPSSISAHHTGKPLKNIQIKHQNTIIKGEGLITDYGIEGNAVYPISSIVRESLRINKKATIYLDLKPQFTIQEIKAKCKNVKPANIGKTLNLNPTKVALIKAFTTKEEYQNIEALVLKIKKLPIAVEGLRPIEEAISTVGGINESELSLDFSLKKHPQIYCIGEMVNWDAPTGGFLLQGCFSMAYLTSQTILKTQS